MKNLSITGLLLLLLVSCQPESASTLSALDSIRINQLGYYPDAVKKFVVVGTEGEREYIVVNKATNEIVIESTLTTSESWELAGETVQVGDFSRLNEVGQYYIQVEGVGISYDFDIKPNLYAEVFLGTLRALYLQRSSTAIPEEFGGVYARTMGHPDTVVNFHPSTGRTGQTSSPKGWYDAGDYGKYVVNGAFPLGQLLTLYEQYPDRFADGTSNIPESGNDFPDYLDELIHEMDWLLTMQDEDGGLFHKLTTEAFEGMIMPGLAIRPRYIIGKGTAATLDFAAVAAKFSRIIVDVDPGYSHQCLAAAEKAWRWAMDNPVVNFKNPEDIATGEYGDTDFSQEFFWAAAELHLSTGRAVYADYLETHWPLFDFKPGGSWANFMHFVGAFALADYAKDDKSRTRAIQELTLAADQILTNIEERPYRQPLNDFRWGSNSDIANAAMILAQAYRYTREVKYLQGVQESVDYIFGKNATGYSFVTGFGHKTPMHIHHRPSAADGIEAPIPGLLSGGPNSGQQDKEFVTYPENVAPMQSWADEEPSYASNEVCLNWNAPLTYILGFLEFEQASLQ